jgi:plastocyanin
MKKTLTILVAMMATFLLMLAGPGQPASAHPARQSAAAPASTLMLAAPQTTTVNFGGTLGFHYNPNVIFIHPGDSLSWEGDFTMHPLVSDESLWTQVSTGTQFTFKFNTPGTYHFHCFFHGPIGMTGTVTVGYRELIPQIDKN